MEGIRVRGEHFCSEIAITENALQMQEITQSTYHKSNRHHSHWILPRHYLFHIWSCLTFDWP